MKMALETPTEIVKRKRGRPTKYNKKVADEICKRIALGESLRAICRDDKMPSEDCVYTWLLDDDKQDFHDKYARSRNAQAEKMFEALNEIADSSLDVIVGGEDKADNARVQAIRLKVDTRKWYLSKVLPKKYGDKLDLTSGGEKLPQPILQLNAVVVKPALPQSATQPSHTNPLLNSANESKQ